jgi:tetratricopeptide (TPR) repeat protein
MLGYVRASHESGDGYRLAPYPLIWVDVDALSATVRQACLLERFGDDPLPSWERAYQLVSRGTYLAEEPYSQWADSRREEVEGHLRQCVHALARLWLARQGEAAEEEVLHLLRGYWPRHPDDEDVAWGLMDLLGRRGRYQEALDVYAVLEQSLEEQGLTKESQPRVPDQRTRDLADYLRLKERPSLVSRPPQRESASPPSAGTLLPVPSMTATGQEEMLALFSSAVKQGLIEAFHQIRNRNPSQLVSDTPADALKRSSVDSGSYERNLRMILHIYRTSNAQDLLQDVNHDIHELAYLEGQTRGDLRSQVRALLFGNRLLAAKIVKDQGRYPLAYGYADAALQGANILQDTALEAAARYTRGCTILEWGLLGALKQGRFQADLSKIHDAIQDFQEILLVARHQPDAIHPQLQGSTQLQLSRALSALTTVEESQVLQFADEAAQMIGCDPINDSYKRIMLTGTLSGLHVGSYHLIRAGIFNALRQPEKALLEMDQFNRLTRQTYHRDETRYQAWSAIVMAEALMGLLEYQEATQKLTQALVICSHINSIQNVSMISDLSHRLIASPYGPSREVKALADMLGEWYKDERRARNGI